MSSNWPWNYEHLKLLASQHHSLKELPGSRNVWQISPKMPALVLGSSQNPDLVNKAKLSFEGVELVVRRSGGGIVYLQPGHFLWLDITIPATDPLFEKNISKASLWLGELFKQALLEFEIRAEVYRGNFTAGPGKGLVCFSSRAPGELLVDSAKILGISQRRTSSGIWFQTLLLLKWNPGLLLDYLLLAPAQKKVIGANLDSAATAVNINSIDFVQTFLRLITAK